MSLQRVTSLHRSGTRKERAAAASGATNATDAAKPKKGYDVVKQGIKVLYPEDESKRTDTE
jgi:hypothetical protein